MAAELVVSEMPLRQPQFYYPLLHDGEVKERRKDEKDGGRREAPDFANPGNNGRGRYYNIGPFGENKASY